MAIDCLALSIEDVATGMGTASATMLPSFLRSENLQQNGVGSSRIMRDGSKVDIISLRLALSLAMEKHAVAGDPRLVKVLIEHYLREFHPNFHRSGRWTVLMNNCRVRGLLDAIRKEWQNNLPSQDWVLFGYVPHLRSAVPPLRFETGLLCEGCQRDAAYAPSFSARFAARKAAEKAHLTSQYLDHFPECETAQLIFRGERFNTAEEKRLQISMFEAVVRFPTFNTSGRDELMNIIRGVELDANPSEVRSSVAIALQ